MKHHVIKNGLVQLLEGVLITDILKWTSVLKLYNMRFWGPLTQKLLSMKFCLYVNILFAMLLSEVSLLIIALKIRLCPWFCVDVAWNYIGPCLSLSSK